MAPSSPSLLSEVSVLDLSIWRPGPYATSLLVGLGADVVKVEPPGGDPMRHYPELFKSVNAGKRSIMLDLKEPDGAGRRRALELAGEADVIVEGFRPGVMARLGLGEPAVRALNAGVVYCSISGYGQQGPLAVAPGHDLNYQAWAGALAPDGGAAVMPPLPLADLASGMTAAFGICAALLGRGAGGPGTYLDISMTDVMATWTGSASSVSDEDPVGGGGGAAGDGGRGRGPGSCLWIPRRAGIRTLLYRGRPAGGARCGQRAALLVGAVHRAGTRRPGWPQLQRTPGTKRGAGWGRHRRHRVAPPRRPGVESPGGRSPGRAGARPRRHDRQWSLPRLPHPARWGPWTIAAAGSLPRPTPGPGVSPGSLGVARSQR